MGGLVSLLAGPGSDDDWGDVVDRYEPTLRRVIMRRTADRSLVEDVLQETYVRAWRARLSGAQRGMPDARWMRLLATRASIDVYRREPPPHEKVDPAALVGAWLTADRAVPPGSDEHVDALVSRQALRWAFRRLTPRQRRLLVSRGVRNLTYREIAEREGISENAVASALNRARERLRANLADYTDGRAGTGALAVGIGVVERLRTRLARVQATIGAHALELAWTTAVLGVAVAVTSPSLSPSSSVEVRAAAAWRIGDSAPMVHVVSPAADDASSDRVTWQATPLSPGGHGDAGTGGERAADAPLHTATTLDVGAQEMTFRVDVVVDLPGIDDRSSLVVQVYCTRNALVSPACPVLDAHEPRNEAITPTRPR